MKRSCLSRKVHSCRQRPLKSYTYTYVEHDKLSLVQLIAALHLEALSRGPRLLALAVVKLTFELEALVALVENLDDVSRVQVAKECPALLVLLLDMLSVDAKTSRCGCEDAGMQILDLGPVLAILG